MINYLRKGDTVDVTLTFAVVGHQPYLFGAGLFGYPMVDGAIGDVVSVKRGGVYGNAPKDPAAAWNAYDLIYWDNTNKVFTTTATNNVRVGIADAAAAQADTIGAVNLDKRVG
jgi:predicted RecA/RadA family phage recombinase